MGHNAVGLEEVGGVSQGARRNQDVQETRSQRSRATADLANTLMSRNFGPAARTQFAGKMSQAGAQNAGANRSSEFNANKVQGERTAVQGASESTQTQVTSANAAESTLGHLNKTL